MKLINEYGSAIIRVYNEEDIVTFLQSGWKPYVEKAKTERTEERPKEVEKVQAPTILEEKQNELMYGDKYLTQWANVATLQQLKNIFIAKGIEFNSRMTKNDMQKKLRQYIRDVKAKQRSEQR